MVVLGVILFIISFSLLLSWSLQNPQHAGCPETVCEFVEELQIVISSDHFLSAEKLPTSVLDAEMAEIEILGEQLTISHTDLLVNNDRIVLPNKELQPDIPVWRLVLVDDSDLLLFRYNDEYYRVVP